MYSGLSLGVVATPSQRLSPPVGGIRGDRGALASGNQAKGKANNTRAMRPGRHDFGPSGRSPDVPGLERLPTYRPKSDPVSSSLELTGRFTNKSRGLIRLNPMPESPSEGEGTSDSENDSFGALLFSPSMSSCLSPGIIDAPFQRAFSPVDGMRDSGGKGKGKSKDSCAKKTGSQRLRPSGQGPDVHGQGHPVLPASRSKSEPASSSHETAGRTSSQRMGEHTILA